MRPTIPLVRLAPAGLGLVLGLLALGPALGPGFVLRYDMVFVPHPPLRFDVGGFPRGVPSDQVVALLSAVLPAELVQKAVLLGVFVLAASGAAALADEARPPGGLAPRLAAAAFYAWNAYLAQRLLIGQWALLLGYAGLPWAVRAAARVARSGGTRRLVPALLPAAVGGFQAVLVTALAVLPVAALARPPVPAGAPAGSGVSARGGGVGTALDGRVRAVLGGRWAAVLGVAAVLLVLSLPWLVPALRADAHTDPAGVDAFAARADGPFGTLGSLLTPGGIWNAQAVVPGQGGLALASARLALAVVAVAGFVRLAGRRPADGPGPPPYARGLAVAACAGVLIACAGAFGPGLLRALVGWWPGFGPFRDGQVYIAPFALLQAAGFGYAAGALARAWSARPALAAAAVPVLVLPTFALGAFGRLGAAGYPDEWRTVQAVVNADPAPGALLSLPWGAYRAFAWNDGRVVLDPATKMFARPVLWDDTLVVGLRGGGRIRVAAENPRARRVGALVSRPYGPLTAALAREGVRYVLVEGPNENRFLPRLPGATQIWRGSELLLLRL
ncbi:hypothetical protein [Microbispora sp. ATCC PTA-5024]|uniref:hypothetical protein n=1 Tax=Microbispora sp. ATCC PTA-5024 TaxID=316330 RepID=UPI0003DB7972|nr:hypothetical protein [Microbispora sp. ATCC PTA-5024]ETK33626.1 hypothetical protein MPTA5024_23605 [Microbispora sp. ATCC PTA-5024]